MEPFSSRENVHQACDDGGGEKCHGQPTIKKESIYMYIRDSSRGVKLDLGLLNAYGNLKLHNVNIDFDVTF